LATIFIYHLTNVRSLNEKHYLCSSDFEEKKIESTKEFPFEKVSNNLGVYFKNEGGSWKMKVRDIKLTSP